VAMTDRAGGGRQMDVTPDDPGRLPIAIMLN
jgi:hypothetical protein